MASTSRRHLPPGLAEYAKDWLKHPNRRAWKFDEVHKEVAVHKPRLQRLGYDHCNGSMQHLQLMQRHGRTERARSQTKLIAGPWNHPSLGSRIVAGFDFGPQAGLDLPDSNHPLVSITGSRDRQRRRSRASSALFRNGRTAGTMALSRHLWPPADATPCEYLLSSDGNAKFGGSGRAGDQRRAHQRRGRPLRLRSPQSRANTVDAGMVHRASRPPPTRRTRRHPLLTAPEPLD